MKMPSGTAPVYLHDLLHALVTSQDGTRPKPKSDGSNEVVPVPVMLQLIVGGQGRARTVTLPLDGWEFMPNRPGRPAKLVFVATHTEPDPDLDYIGSRQEAADASGTYVPPFVAGAGRGHGDTPEALAVAATRAANGLPESTDPAAFDANADTGADLDGKKD